MKNTVHSACYCSMHCVISKGVVVLNSTTDGTMCHSMVMACCCQEKEAVELHQNKPLPHLEPLDGHLKTPRHCYYGPSWSLMGRSQLLVSLTLYSLSVCILHYRVSLPLSFLLSLPPLSLSFSLYLNVHCLFSSHANSTANTSIR